MVSSRDRNCYAGSPLWLTLTDVDPNKTNVPLSRLRERGPYVDWKTLLETHIDLLSEDFLCAVSEQVSNGDGRPRNFS